jgi:hypothetical protein
VTDDLVQFIRARLDEEKRDAHAAADGAPGADWGVMADDIEQVLTSTSNGVTHTPLVQFGADDPVAVLTHIARHDPARVLTGIEAKRRLVDDMAKIVGGDYIDDGEPVLAEWALLLLALPYADHPDYREEWRP